jgi:hypothetical protein
MHSNGSSKNQKSNKAAQPMMQSLEPRRLMSLSGAVEMPDPGIPHPIPALHSFGFENHPFESAPARIFEISPAEPAVPVSISDLEAQIASAIARGNSVSISIPPTPSATPTPIYSDSSDRSLSAMYASLETSTLAAIDEAAVVSQADVVAQANPGGSIASLTASPGLTTSPNPGVTITANPIVANAVDTPLLVVTPGMVAAVPQENVEPCLLHPEASLESQLEAISVRAAEAISQLGRDMAISLAHLEDEIVEVAAPAMQQLSSWRGGALVAGAMVAAVYLQSRAKEEKSQQGSVFSKKIVQVEVPEAM